MAVWKIPDKWAAHRKIMENHLHINGPFPASHVWLLESTQAHLELCALLCSIATGACRASCMAHGMEVTRGMKKAGEFYCAHKLALKLAPDLLDPYIYSHPGLDRIWSFQTYSLKYDDFWKSPYSIYFRMAIHTRTHTHTYIYIPLYTHI